MALRGYIRKTKPAYWLSVPGAKPVAVAVRAERHRKARTRIRPQSKRNTARRREYVAKRDAWLVGKRCAGCGEQAGVELHHHRGRIGSLLCDDRFWMPFCNGCHRWIHDNIEKARARGWIAAAGDWNKTVKP